MYGYRTGYSVPARPRTAFSPLLLSEVAEMWDPAHGLDLVTGNRVRAWTGRKIGRTVQQLSTQQQPVWSATAMGGGPGIGFDGTDDMLAAAASGWFPSGNAPLEIWTVVQQDARAATDTANRSAITYGNGVFASDMRQRRNTSAGTLTDRYQITVGTGTTTSTPSYDNVNFVSRHVLRIRAGADVTRYAIDAFPYAQTTIARNTAGTNLVFGGLVGGGQHWLGAMSYIVFVNGLLGDIASDELLTWALARRNL